MGADIERGQETWPRLRDVVQEQRPRAPPLQQPGTPPPPAQRRYSPRKTLLGRAWGGNRACEREGQREALYLRRSRDGRLHSGESGQRFPGVSSSTDSMRLSFCLSPEEGPDS